MKLNIKLKYEDDKILGFDIDDTGIWSEGTWIDDDDVLIAANQHNLGLYFLTSLEEILVYAGLGLKFARQGNIALLQAHLDEFNKMLADSTFSSRKIT